MADGAVSIRERMIRRDAEPLEVYRNPADLFVAGFFRMPSMNFREGEPPASCSKRPR